MSAIRRSTWQAVLGFAFVACVSSCSGDAESGPAACAGKGGDADKDDVCQAVDNCPDNANASQRDADEDGVGDACDATPVACDAHGGDSDNDTVCDAFDNCPRTINLNQRDRDFDDLGDACDRTPDGATGAGGADGAGGAPGSAGAGGVTSEPPGSAGSGSGEECRGIGGDVDGDDWCGLNDNCFSVYNPDQSDVDDDGKGDACDKESCDGLDNDGNGVVDDDFSDADDDGVADCVDKCAKAEDKDSDNDGTVDCRDKCPDDALNDPDFDGICSGIDNCPLVSNANQLDSDDDETGDVCELDVCDGIDNDGDGSIDENGGGPDEDGDRLCDAVDWCPTDPFNDIDGDGVCGNEDNCVGVTNPSQSDGDEDGLGDTCDLDEPTACGASAALGSSALPAGLVFEYAALDVTRSLILGTVKGSSTQLPNRLVAIDPATQMIVWSLLVGSDPGRIAVSSDGSRAYVSLSGAASIRVVDLVKRSACYSFPIVSAQTREVLTPNDMVVLPGRPETLVVAARRGSYYDANVQVLDNGGPRPSAVASASSSYPAFIELIDESRIWAQSSYSSYGVVELRIDDAGIHMTRPSNLPNVIPATGAEMVYAGQLMYLTNGQVYDPAIPRLVGTFPASGLLAVDVPRNEVFIASNFSYSGTNDIKVFDTRTFTLVRSLPIPLPTPSTYSSTQQMFRWGSTGLILNTSSGIRFMTIGI